ncbi:MAG TPA: chromate transporter, partial [Solirubrobacteraceae bacterium]|nr:chromate transporter [Solirubrobacteraceae bacterium]
MLLAHELVERLRAHPRGQRAVGRRPVFGALVGRVEETVHEDVSSRTVRRAPLSVVVREWARIGITSFGGPPAQVALLRELCVERRQWISPREFEDANAATQ